MKIKRLLYSLFLFLFTGFILFPINILPNFSSQAFAIQFETGELQGSLDTTVSYGLRWRVQGRDKDIIGLTNGGNAFSVNGDNGNLNFSTGLVSSAPKITSDLELDYRNFSAFVRGSAFYDFEVKEGERDKIELTGDALDLVGSDARILDAYVSGSFDILDRPLQLRVGNQVVSWGEGTFFQGGINTINPIDVSAIRVPGAELKEALVPEGMVYGSMGLTNNLSFEGLYLYDWDNTDIDPPGSYFATTDVAGAGGKKVMLAFGSISDEGTDLGPLGFDPDFLAVERGPSENADDQGQFGFAFRYFSEYLNDTEFGFYFVNYHSRVPILSARTGTEEGVAKSTTAAFLATLAAVGGDVGTAAGLTVNNYSRTGYYFTEYPEDIQMYGVSFNTDLGNTGIALQGEIAYRQDLPLQMDDVELVLAYLSPIGFNPTYKDNQVGIFSANEIIHGYIERDVVQGQMTATKVFGPTFGADTFLVLGEVGITHVDDMPSTSELRLESAGTYTSGNSSQALPPATDPTKPFGGAHAGKPSEPASHFADADSWGYRLVSRLVYENAIGAVGLIPRVSWQHDVSGNSPAPGGNFIEHRKAISAGITATYLTSWSFDVSYTNYFGADRYNLVNDRDFVETNIKYSF
jgi:hypothetical protein